MGGLARVRFSAYLRVRRYRLYSDMPTSFDLSPETGSFERHVEGLTALLLSLKKRPVIRYERMSNMAKKLGQDLIVRCDLVERACLSAGAVHLLL